MDENKLYETIGRVYSELLNASNIIQSQKALITKLQKRVSELELSSSKSKVKTREAQPFVLEDGNMQITNGN